MKNRDIYITDQDMKLLNDLLETARRFNYHNRTDLAKLEVELGHGQIIPSAQVPPDVITMNSTVCLIDLETGDKVAYTLVFPNEADIEQNRISILAPIGMALLGYKVGDAVEWQVPGGLSRLQVKEILYQPEANGVVETDMVDFSPSGQARWRDTLDKLSKHHEVFDDYSYS